MDTEPDIARLLGACARQDRRAFQQLYELTSPQLLACLDRMLRNRALAEDALQDVFVQIWRRAGQFQIDRGTAWAWLITIARYRAVDLLRSERREVDSAPGSFENIASDAEPHDTQMTMGHRASSALDRCLTALQPRQRDCILLCFNYGLTHTEVSARINQPLGSVKSWVRRGLAALRRCLES
ncbi:MAG: sigma-70 family RNA polymerase sigma factor [Sphingomonadaceae bacterium]